jgi:hypothetical protein
MLTCLFAFDDVNAVLDEEANSGAGILAELLIADRNLKLSRLIGDRIVMVPISLRGGVT